MLIEADLVAERLVANVASERPLAVVRAAGVNFQAVRSGEHFLALDAGEIGRAAAATSVAAGRPAASAVVVETLQRIRMLIPVVRIVAGRLREPTRVEKRIARLLMLRRLLSRRRSHSETEWKKIRPSR
jgi:hypothetical protein